jgi:hypothetical protein
MPVLHDLTLREPSFPFQSPHREKTGGRGIYYLSFCVLPPGKYTKRKRLSLVKVGL